MLYAQFLGASSLREIETGLNSHAPRLYHLGAVPSRRPLRQPGEQVGKHRARRWPTPIPSDRLDRRLRRTLAETTYLIDATAGCG